MKVTTFAWNGVTTPRDLVDDHLYLTRYFDA